MNYKAIPLFLVLAVMVVPLSNIPTAEATDSPLTFGATYQLDTDISITFDDSEASLEDGMHWLWHQEGGGSPISLYYSQSVAGEQNPTPILIQGIDESSDEIHDDADLIIDGTTVYVFYGYSDDNSGSGAFYNLYMKKSTDNGLTFGSRVLIDNTVFNQDSMFGEGIVAKQDVSIPEDLYVFWKCDDDCDTDENTIGVMLSEDSGATWDRQADVSGIEYFEHFQYDPYFQGEGIHIEDGVIQIAFELYDDDNLGDYTVRYNASEDKGATWKFGYDGDDGNLLRPLFWDDEASDSVPQIVVAGSTTMVIWNVSGQGIHYNRTTDLGDNFETEYNDGAIDLSTNGFCDSADYRNWNVGQIGSYVALVCSGSWDDHLMFVDSLNLGADWNSPVVLVADDELADDDFWDRVNVDTNSNNMVFTAYAEMEDDTDWETWLIYAQDPMSSADFVVEELTQVNGVEMTTPSGLQDLPMACLSGNELYVTWQTNSGSNLFWYEAPLSNSGITPPDTTNPVIIPSFPPEPINLIQFHEFDPLRYASASDDVDGDLTQFIMVEINGVDITETGIYTVTYEVVDMAMNLGTADIDFFVKRQSGSGSSGGGSSSGSGSSMGGVSTDRLTLPPEVDVDRDAFFETTTTPAPLQLTPDRAFDLFSFLRGEDASDGGVSPAVDSRVAELRSQQGTTQSQATNNPISNFFSNLFCIFGNC